MVDLPELLIKALLFAVGLVLGFVVTAFPVALLLDALSNPLTAADVGRRSVRTEVIGFGLCLVAGGLVGSHFIRWSKLFGVRSMKRVCDLAGNTISIMLRIWSVASVIAFVGVWVYRYINPPFFWRWDGYVFGSMLWGIGIPIVLLIITHVVAWIMKSKASAM